ncbi:hypothetical protein SBF1_7360003 [Candidatus Desulfosporosinus infrequens]|uniref:Uncharacterized protein n=1 Tax=Candidatus Desulfosporosinus infrequens TaxID=2043169 RepID=A0A2U3LQH9_9FIRM|nr:hypothetical protein SBF1_7360003 [Candidatus Desulfosporosinus infrequens]
MQVTTTPTGILVLKNCRPYTIKMLKYSVRVETTHNMFNFRVGGEDCAGQICNKQRRIHK